MLFNSTAYLFMKRFPSPSRLFLAMLFYLLAGVNLLFAQQGAENILRSGDSILIKLSGVPAEESAIISMSYDISDKGMVNLAYIGEIQASGMRPSDLQKKIESAYRNAEIYTRPTIQVTPNREIQGTVVVYVSGEVKNPQAVPLRSGMSVHDAITTSGGPTDFAKMKAVKLTRGSVTRQLDLRNADNPDAQLPALVGDKIHVP